MQNWRFWIFAGPALIGLIIGIRRWFQTESGRKFKDIIKLQTPLLKNLFSRVYMARFCRTVGTLFGSGISLIESLQIVTTGIKNYYIEAGIARASSEIQAGIPFSKAIGKQEYFLDLVSDMIAIGEQSGQTEDMLMKAADYYEKEVDRQIEALTTAMEPIMIVSLGIVAVLIILAILLPIFNLIQQNKVSLILFWV